MYVAIKNFELKKAPHISEIFEHFSAIVLNVGLYRSIKKFQNIYLKNIYINIESIKIIPTF